MTPSPTTLLSQARRQNTTATPLPSACFPICLRALLEAQYAGKYAPVLCSTDPPSNYQVAITACITCLKEYAGLQSGNAMREINDYFSQFTDFCNAAVDTSSAAPFTASSSGTGAASSTVFGSSAPLPATSSSTEASSAETLTTSVLRTSVVTSTQAGTTATSTTPGTIVYESLSLTVTTVRSPITSLSLCSQLTINPTYTITGTIPSDWTWGCPPGSKCSPPKNDCNYEVLPADTYHCSPNDCVPVYALPSATITTIPFPFVQDYIYLNPSAFGLSVDRVFDVETTSTSTETLKSTSIESFKTTSTETFKSTSTASHTPTPSHSSHKVSTGVIAGSTVGGVASLAITIALLSFLLLRRRRRQKRALAAPTFADEKAQLHSEDVKPIRTELDGGIKRKPVPPREMAANEHPARTLNELPANEIVGSEMEVIAGKSSGAQ